MSKLTKIFCGVIILTIPTIQYGGYFLLQNLSGNYDQLNLTEFQESMFRAGHAHAGVLVILSLIAQALIDHSSLNKSFEWLARIGFPLAAILVSGGFFSSAIGSSVSEPNNLIVILYAGIIVLFFSLLILGVGLLKAAKNS